MFYLSVSLSLCFCSEVTIALVAFLSPPQIRKLNSLRKSLLRNVFPFRIDRLLHTVMYKRRKHQICLCVF